MATKTSSATSSATDAFLFVFWAGLSNEARLVKMGAYKSCNKNKNCLTLLNSLANLIYLGMRKRQRAQEWNKGVLQIRPT